MVTLVYTFDTFVTLQTVQPLLDASEYYGCELLEKYVKEWQLISQDRIDMHKSDGHCNLPLEIIPFTARDSFVPPPLTLYSATDSFSPFHCSTNDLDSLDSTSSQSLRSSSNSLDAKEHVRLRKLSNLKDLVVQDISVWIPYCQQPRETLRDYYANQGEVVVEERVKGGDGEERYHRFKTTSLGIHIHQPLINPRVESLLVNRMASPTLTPYIKPRTATLEPLRKRSSNVLDLEKPLPIQEEMMGLFDALLVRPESADLASLLANPDSNGFTLMPTPGSFTASVLTPRPQIPATKRVLPKTPDVSMLSNTPLSQDIETISSKPPLDNTSNVYAANQPIAYLLRYRHHLDRSRQATQQPSRCDVTPVRVNQNHLKRFFGWVGSLRCLR